MLNREQWENLAKFAGITIEEDGVDVNGLTWHWSPELDKHWNPEFDWRDFGPLLRKLKRWLGSYPKDKRFPTTEIYAAYQWLSVAEYDAVNDQEFMQAGCLLGAAIGATMKGDKA